MAYSYLLDLYQVLTEREAEILLGGKVSGTTETDELYRHGQLEANREFLTFLKENYHSKLPRRLQKQ